MARVSDGASSSIVQQLSWLRYVVRHNEIAGRRIHERPRMVPELPWNSHEYIPIPDTSQRARGLVLDERVSHNREVSTYHRAAEGLDMTNAATGVV